MEPSKTDFKKGRSPKRNCLRILILQVLKKKVEYVLGKYVEFK